MRILLWSFGEESALRYLDFSPSKIHFRLLASRPIRESISVVQATKFVVICPRRPRTLGQMESAGVRRPYFSSWRGVPAGGHPRPRGTSLQALRQSDTGLHAGRNGRQICGFRALEDTFKVSKP